MTEKDMILALSPMIEKLLTQSFLAYLEYCPTIEIPAREKLCAVLHEGQWVFRADSDFVKEMLSSFNMFE